MKIVVSILSLILFSSCVESSFQLAEDSPLPNCFQIPDTLKRSDFSVTYNLYSNKAELILFQKETNKKLASITGANKIHPLTLKNSNLMKYPSYSIFRANQVEEFIEHRTANNLFHISTEEDITLYYKNHNNETLKTPDLNKK